MSSRGERHTTAAYLPGFWVTAAPTSNPPLDPPGRQGGQRWSSRPQQGDRRRRRSRRVRSARSLGGRQDAIPGPPRRRRAGRRSRKRRLLLPGQSLRGVAGSHGLELAQPPYSERIVAPGRLGRPSGETTNILTVVPSRDSNETWRVWTPSSAPVVCSKNHGRVSFVRPS